MERKHPVTIVDVAAHAGVSAGTVSNVLTGKRPVAEATRERVLRAVEELGYQPNLLARSLVNRSSNTIGVVTYGLEYYGPSRTLVGIERAAAELGYSLLLDLLHEPDVADVDVVLEELTARRVDGIIWAVHEVGDNRAWIDEERLRALPPIVFLTMAPRPGASIVSTDNCAGAQIATRHLLATGRRTIGIITGPLSWWEARQRLEGWRRALEEAGIESNHTLIYEGSWLAASGEAAMEALLNRQPNLDAVFACNDQMALGALRYCHAHGIRVPDELSIVGFDNIPESAFFWPALTTVRQHLLDLGRVAVEELHHRIELRLQDVEPEPPTIHLLQPELIVRESTLPPRSVSS
ncbi:LacI family DNA-binding transcriptional regulator [Caldilinea sp.]|uniref:LacI family DNA-binding transcriptional regulator n=1 Tax=Caldilinea sp. TaxID=2293560 RepID=UPI001B2589FE|nr:LacI family DNA-binding transcriptional regulator [Caldilinea sp.]MBO9394442.1 LacI family DNA-binding transcriptional regulator [Caldilinea sp.]